MHEIEFFLLDIKYKILKYDLECKVNNLIDQNKDYKISVIKLRCKIKRIKDQLVKKENLINNIKEKYRYHFTAVYRERNFYRRLYEKENGLKYKNICKYLLQNNKKSIDDSCAICLCNLDDEIFTLPCNHSFHFDCYCKIENDKCPLCRKETRF